MQRASSRERATLALERAVQFQDLRGIEAALYNGADETRFHIGQVRDSGWCAAYTRYAQTSSTPREGILKLYQSQIDLALSEYKLIRMWGHRPKHHLNNTHKPFQALVKDAVAASGFTELGATERRFIYDETSYIDMLGYEARAEEAVQGLRYLGVPDELVCMKLCTYDQRRNIVPYIKDNYTMLGYILSVELSVPYTSRDHLDGILSAMDSIRPGVEHFREANCIRIISGTAWACLMAMFTVDPVMSFAVESDNPSTLRALGAYLVFDGGYSRHLDKAMRLSIDPGGFPHINSLTLLLNYVPHPSEEFWRLYTCLKQDHPTTHATLHKWFADSPKFQTMLAKRMKTIVRIIAFQNECTSTIDLSSHFYTSLMVHLGAGSTPACNSQECCLQ